MTASNFNGFNELAEKWDVMHHHDSDKIKKMLDLLYIKNNARVLDVGCGTGILIPFLLEKTNSENIFAIDGAEKMIEKAGQKFPGSGINFIAADVIDYNFNRDYFDHIICYSVFPHFEDKKDIIQRFSELLKKGGLLSILHSESRETINNMHYSRNEVDSDSLSCPMAYIPFCRQAGLIDEIVIDNNEMYMLCCRKQ